MNIIFVFTLVEYIFLYLISLLLYLHYYEYILHILYIIDQA